MTYKDYNLVGLAVNISRIYEVSKVGDFSVKLVSYDNLINERDLQLLRDFYSFSFEDPADIIAEVAFAPQDIISVIYGSNHFETLSIINERIEETKRSSVIVDRTLDRTCISLFKQAIEKLSLCVSDIFKIIDIAEVIAKMASHTKIKPEDLAEAIQYKSIPI